MAQTAEILSTETPALFDTAVARAAELLRQGEVVALPTETVYGLAANAFDADAIRRIFEIKGRPAHNPIIVHVASLEQARRCVRVWPDAAQRLAAAFWPGPLTLVLPRAEIIPDIVTAGGNTVGVRWPSHPLMQAVIRACGFPLAAPSANLSNRVSPTRAEHVRKALGDRIPLILDGGQAQVGIESAVVDLTSARPRVLRPGMIHEESILAALGPSAELAAPAAVPSGEPLRSPGQLDLHYAPRGRVCILAWRDEEELRRRLAERGIPAETAHVIAHTHIPLHSPFRQVSVIPHDAPAFARAIYAELHRCDDEGAEWIVIESLPAGPDWEAIRDRLQRAVGGLDRRERR